MQNLLIPFYKEIFEILKKSFLLYFQNIHRLIEIIFWVCLPASILFILMFYWGLPEKILHMLGAFSYLGTLMVLLFLNVVVLKRIQSVHERASVGTFRVFEESISLFFSYLWILVLILARVVVWALPFFVMLFLFSKRFEENGLAWLWAASLIFSHVWAFVLITLGSLSWVLPFSALILTPTHLVQSKGLILAGGTAILLLIPVLAIVCYYSFATFAFLIDGKKGIEALRYSKKLVKAKFWKFGGWILFLCLIMQPFYKFIYFGIDYVQSIPLKAVNLFPLISLNCLLNVVSVTIIFFPIVVFYFLYKMFRI